MLTNVGLNWSTETVPEDLKNKAKSSKDNKDNKNNNNYLYEIDFIHLTEFLFKKYTTIDGQPLIEKLKKINNLEEVNLDELKCLVPKSNWDRYFSEYVECNDSYLSKRWKQLYDLRCKIAHNNAVTKNEYEQVIKLVDEIQAKLNKAIENLDKIEVPEHDRENLAETVAISINALHGEYINKWKFVQKQLCDLLDLKLRNIIDQSRFKQLNHNILALLELLLQKEVIDEDLYYDIKNARSFRNIIVHEADIRFDESVLRDEIKNIDRIHEKLNEYFLQGDNE